MSLEEEREVVDLLPIPLRRALNFRLVACIVGRRLASGLLKGKCYYEMQREALMSRCS